MVLREDGYLWMKHIRVCMVGAYRKSEQDTTFYLYLDGLEVPQIMTKYSRISCESELKYYSSELKPDEFQYLSNRIKRYKMIDMLSVGVTH